MGCSDPTSVLSGRHPARTLCVTRSGCSVVLSSVGMPGALLLLEPAHAWVALVTALLLLLFSLASRSLSRARALSVQVCTDPVTINTMTHHYHTTL